jgi:hypothetical protein
MCGSFRITSLGYLQIINLFCDFTLNFYSNLSTLPISPNSVPLLLPNATATILPNLLAPNSLNPTNFGGIDTSYIFSALGSNYLYTSLRLFKPSTSTTTSTSLIFPKPFHNSLCLSISRHNINSLSLYFIEG